MIIVEVSTTSTLINFTLRQAQDIAFQDPPEPGRRITVHQASRHPLGPLPIPFFELAAFRLNKIREKHPAIPLPEFTVKEVEEAVKRWDEGTPEEGQVVNYRPDSSRWGR